MELTLTQLLNPNPKPYSVYMQSYGKPFVQYFQCFD